jgi:GNAT superfamily N-acetyltransferase
VIRRASIDDLPQMLELWRALEEAQREFRVLPTRADAEERVSGMLREAIADENAAVFVVDDDGQLVGMAIAEVSPTGAHSLADAMLCELSRVVIAPERRGEGLGTGLLEAAEEFGRARGAAWLSARIFTGNEAGRAFWARHGFVPRYEQRVRMISAPEDADTHFAP